MESNNDIKYIYIEIGQKIAEFENSKFLNFQFTNFLFLTVKA